MNVKSKSAKAENAQQRFAALYRNAQPDVLAFVARRCYAAAGSNSLVQAEDITHEAFLVAWKRFDEIPANLSDARAWLFTVARNCLLNDGRAVAKRGAMQVQIADDAFPILPNPHDVTATRIDLKAAWQKLPPDYQEVLALAAWDGLDSKQAAKVLSITSTAYRMRLSRARATLKQAIEPEAEQEPAPAALHHLAFA